MTKPAKRRHKGEGHIRQRADGRQEMSGMFELEDGTRKRLSFYAPTLREVQRKYREARADEAQGKLQRAERKQRITVAEYLQEWLEVDVLPRCKASTYRDYASKVRQYISPRLGKVLVSELTTKRVQLWINSMHADNYARNTTDGVRNILRAAMHAAVRDGLRERNPVTDTKVPQERLGQGRCRQNKGVWTPAESQKLLAYLKANNEPYEVFYVLAITLGLRHGELLGLQWQDVNLDEGTLQVAHTMTRGKARLLDTPKNHRKRGIILPSITVAALRRHRARQNQARLKAGPLWQGDKTRDFIVTTALGRSVNFESMRIQHYRLLKRAGLPPIRVHDMRHTSATIGLVRRVPVPVVSKRLGHASPAITAKIYMHVLDEIQREEADEMDLALGFIEPVENVEGVDER